MLNVAYFISICIESNTIFQYINENLDPTVHGARRKKEQNIGILPLSNRRDVHRHGTILSHFCSPLEVEAAFLRPPLGFPQRQIKSYFSLPPPFQSPLFY